MEAIKISEEKLRAGDPGERLVNTRKEHDCWSCNAVIHAGEKAWFSVAAGYNDDRSPHHLSFWRHEYACGIVLDSRRNAAICEANGHEWEEVTKFADPDDDTPYGCRTFVCIICNECEVRQADKPEISEESIKNVLTNLIDVKFL